MLRAAGYTGPLGLEYYPTVESAESLKLIHPTRRRHERARASRSRSRSASPSSSSAWPSRSWPPPGAGRGDVENVFSRYMHYHNAFEDERIVDELWVRRGTEGVRPSTTTTASTPTGTRSWRTTGAARTQLAS